ncbi:MAG: hypothetical protein IKE81_00455 [Clostridia bacterium]|nr:hypothetical protein [Clostridia bacterium]
MKRIFCLLLSFLLLLSSAGLCESDGGYSAANTSAGEEKGGDNIGKEGSVGPRSYADFAVTGPFLWQVMNGVLRCTDVRTRQTAAEMPLAALYPEEEFYLALTSSNGGVTLCAAVNAGPTPRVTLYRLELQDGRILCSQTTDATEKLAFLFDSRAAWLEVDLTGCAGGLLVSALGQDQNYQLSLYNPADGTLRELGTQPMFSYTGVFSYGEDILLIGPTQEAPEDEVLTRIQLPSGERETLGAVLTGTLSQPDCLALDEGNQTLYYFDEGIGYRASIGGNVTPEAFCTISEEAAPLRYGALSEGQYIFLNIEGGLIYTDANGTLSAETLRILSLADSDQIQDILQTFNTTNADYLTIITSGDNPTDILNAVMNQSADYDAFVISLGSDLYEALSAKGYLGDMSGSSSLTAAAGAYPERILKRIRRDGKLTAFPVGIQNNVLLLDLPALTEITGMSREEIPLDWIGFLELLDRIGENGWLEDAKYQLFEDGVSADTFRIVLLTMILQDAMLWLNEDENRLPSLQATLTPILQKLDRIDWTRLGLPAEDAGDENWASDEEKPALLEWVSPEIAVMNIREGCEYWPLSLSANEAALVPQDVAVLVLNPWSNHPEGVIRVAETIEKEMDIITRMELDRTMNDPVENKNYDEDIEYLKTLVPMYEKAIAEADDEEEAAELREEMDDMLEFLGNYEKSAAWLVSEESIALYRALEDLFAIHGDEFWNNESQNSIFLQYIDGMLDADQFVYQLVNTLRMSRMETE